MTTSLQRDMAAAVVPDYPWPSEEYHALALLDARGSEALAQAQHAVDLLVLDRERKARGWMERNGWHTSPDGSWRNKAGDNGATVYSNIMAGLERLARTGRLMTEDEISNARLKAYKRRSSNGDA